MKIDHTLSGELGWHALHYVAHSLDDAQRERFEQRLLDDQSARQAVAQAVELAHTVAVLHCGNIGTTPDATLVSDASSSTESIGIASPVSARPPRPDTVERTMSPELRTPQPAFWNSRSAWFGVGIAASLAVVVAWQNLLSDRLPAESIRAGSRAAPIAQSTGDGDRAREHLSLAWANMHSQGSRASTRADANFSPSVSLADSTAPAEGRRTADSLTASDVAASETIVSEHADAANVAAIEGENVVLEWIVTGLQDINLDERKPAPRGKLPANEM